MRVYVMLPFFQDGGVERWAINAQSAMRACGHDVEIYSLLKGNTDARHPNSINFVSQCQFGLLPILRIVARNLGAEDVVYVAALTKMNLVFALVSRLFGLRAISSIHLSLGRKDAEGALKPKLRAIAHKLILRWSDKVICVSDGIRKDLATIEPKFLDKVYVIYNPCYEFRDIFIEQASANHPSLNPKAKVRIIAAGRLHEQKGFDLLIEAISLLPDNLKDKVVVDIFGEGVGRSQLSETIRDLGTDNVFLKGYSSNLFSELERAEIFVLSSRYEGFGNVLAEALAAGCHCISYDIDHGPREILDGGRFGALVPRNDVRALSLSIGEHIRAVAESRASGLDAASQRKAKMLHLRKFSVEHFAGSINRLLDDFN